MSQSKGASRGPSQKPQKPGSALRKDPQADPSSRTLRWVPEPNGSQEASKLPDAVVDPKAALILPGLHVVSTPIGNLGDMTFRAVETLQAADIVLCEDTRVSRTLCRRFAIATPLAAYHEHNAERMRPQILARLTAGGRVALISDAGTPLVSDPGYKLVRQTLAEGHAVHVVPGASAVLSALVLSGLPSDRFFFAGFLPPKQTARRRELAALAIVPATLIFYESGPRLAQSLGDMAAVLGDRSAAVAREITKLHEETRRAGLNDLARHYAAAGGPRGEIAVVVAPPSAPEAPSADDLDAALLEAIEKDGMRDAASEIAKRFDLPRRDVYARALILTGREPGS